MRRNLFAWLTVGLVARMLGPDAAIAQTRRADTTSYVRLIFVANCFTVAENSAFRYAAANLVSDYERDTASRQTIKRIYFDNARQIVDSINHQRQLIRSVDFLSHSRDDRIGATVVKGNVQYRTSLFESRRKMQEVQWHNAGGSLHNSYKMASADEIDFSGFSYDAVIEIHGCHAGMEEDTLPVNICKRLSLGLYMSGKQLAVVIGHGTRANPNQKKAMSRSGGSSATNSSGFKASVLSQDYRHGLRLVYFDGRAILATYQPGAIPQPAIIAAIVQAQNAPARGARGAARN
ncbi:MAG: hypothetical protein P4L51_04765 [Puia sp.]|nr:hypothetical protein [Puia sp.]